MHCHSGAGDTFSAASSLASGKGRTNMPGVATGQALGGLFQKRSDVKTQLPQERPEGMHDGSGNRTSGKGNATEIEGHALKDVLHALGNLARTMVTGTRRAFGLLGDSVNRRPAVTGLLCLLLLLLLIGGLFTSQNRPYFASNSETRCLALNIYHEARGEPLEGKIAVGHVVINRVSDDAFPDSICAVVKDGHEHKRHNCQFSWWCDGRSDDAEDDDAWLESLEIAGRIMSGRSEDPTAGALWYHADTVSPHWGREFTSVGQIGRHIFYQRPRAGRDDKDS